ncbi:hypothetical protein ACVBEF_18505 [Glaciimonas sp. GG7]
MRYAQRVSEKKENGFSSLNYPKLTDRAMRFFYVCIPLLRLHWAALMGGFGLPVALDTGLLTRLCRPPFLAGGSGFNNIQGSHNMFSCTATRTQTRPQIIQRLTSQINTVAAMLSVFDVLSAIGHKNALTHAHELTTDISIDRQH